MFSYGNSNTGEPLSDISMLKIPSIDSLGTRENIFQFVKDKVENGGIKAVVFDLDGTICDSELYQFVTLKFLLKMCGSDFSFQDEQFRQNCPDYETAGFRQLIEKKLERAGNSCSYQDFMRIFRATMSNLFEKLGQKMLRPGIMETLEYLHGKNIPIGMVTLSTISAVKIKLNALGISDYFKDEFILPKKEGEPSKPSPEPYIKLAKKLGITDNYSILGIEDTSIGMKSLTGAGYSAVLYMGTSYVEPHLKWVHIHDPRKHYDQIDDYINEINRTLQEYSNCNI